MANTFSLKVIACDRIFFDGRCTQVVLPLHDGEKAIQAHHENMVFAVEIGEIRITDENGKEITGITGTGFAQIINNRATVTFLCFTNNRQNIKTTLPINLHFRKRCINCLFIAILWEKYPI